MSQNIREACDDIEHAVTLGNEGFIGEVQRAITRIRAMLPKASDKPSTDIPAWMVDSYYDGFSDRIFLKEDEANARCLHLNGPNNQGGWKVVPITVRK